MGRQQRSKKYVVIPATTHAIHYYPQKHDILIDGEYHGTIQNRIYERFISDDMEAPDWDMNVLRYFQPLQVVCQKNEEWYSLSTPTFSKLYRTTTKNSSTLRIKFSQMEKLHDSPYKHTEFSES